jgi:hypothetical protein
MRRFSLPGIHEPALNDKVLGCLKKEVRMSVHPLTEKYVVPPVQKRQTIPVEAR